VKEPLQELIGTALSFYAVEAMLARGRSGVVFRAQDTRTNRPVALKVLLPELSRNDEVVQRLVRAMRTMLPLRHPNLVAVYGAGKTGPNCWVAMEYVEGESLTGVMRRAGAGGKLDWPKSLRVAVHVGRALEHAHGHGIVHRNITPANVLFRDSDQVAKLGDLMLAKALEGMFAEEITRPGEHVGDPAYLSPEQTNPRPEVDGRSDLYSLGALVYCMLTGRPPLQGQTVIETMTLIRTGVIAPLATLVPALPADFGAAIHRMLEKQPADRFPSAAEMLRELERIATQYGVAV
jgi:serine/threonine-protein kinase